MSDRVSQPEDLVVVCGDFNVEPTSETLAMFLAAGCSELVTGCGFTSTRSSYYDKPGKFADYMLVNRMHEVTGFDVIVEPDVSDHCPLLLRL